MIDWLRNSADVEYRRFWIDGFMPEIVTNTKRGADVTGYVWMAGGRNQQQFEFTVNVPQSLLYRPSSPFALHSVHLDTKRRSLAVVLAKAALLDEPPGLGSIHDE